MKVLVLGGNGFLGSHVVDCFLAAGEDVRVLSRHSNRFRATPTAVDERLADWRDPYALDEAITGCDVVVHLIGSTVPVTSYRKPLVDIESDVVTTVRMMDRCVVRGVRKVVFASSGGTVYGPARCLPISELHPTEPISEHGIGKLTMEKYLGLYHYQGQLDIAIARIGNAYGERQDLRMGLGFVATSLARIAADRPVVLWGDGNVIRDFVHARDVAESLWLLAHDGMGNAGQRPATVVLTAYPAIGDALGQLRPTVYNVGSGEGHSLRQVMDILAEVTGRQPDIEWKPERPFDVPQSVLDITRITSTLGWAPTTDLATGIARTWKWMQSVGEAALL